MIVSILAIAVILAAFLQPSKTRRRTALCFVLPLIVSELTYSYVTGQLYYFYASLIAIFISFLLQFASSPTRFALNLQLICIVSIVLNVFGWAIYRLKFQPDIYNNAFIILYAITLLLMIFGRRARVGTTRMASGFFSVLRHASPVCRRIP